MRDQKIIGRRYIFTSLLSIILIIVCSTAVTAPIVEYYAPISGVGGNFTYSPASATLTPDGSVAWDRLDNQTQLYIYNFQNLPSSGQINNIFFGLRSNFSSPGVGDDNLTLEYSLDATNWKNLVGSIYDGTSVSNQSLALTTEYYLLNPALSWLSLSSIYLGVQGKLVGGSDSKMVGIDAIWLRVDYTDIEPPLIDLIRPIDGNWSVSHELVFSYNVTDALSEIFNCSLILNNHINATNISVLEGVEQIFSVSGLVEGTYNWSVNCTDNSTGHNSNSSTISTFSVDSSPPQIWLESPADNVEWNTTPTVLFNYNATDNIGNLSNCYLIIDNLINGSISSSVPEGMTQIFSRTISNGYHNWSVNCTDNSGIVGNSSTYILGVDVHYPNITSLNILDPINLAVASAVEVQCNVSVEHTKGISRVANVNAILYSSAISGDGPNDKNNHYSNSSCLQVSAAGNYGNYTCSFQVYYYSDYGNWKCNVTAVDINGLQGSRETNFTIDTLYGLSITPNYINFSALHVGENSTSDTNISITNYGNIEVDITLYGYGYTKGDGLSMNCTLGNISIESERYSLIQDISYKEMYSLSSTAIQIDTFNLAKQTLEGANSSRIVHWKVGVPYGTGGSCRGNVVIGAVPS